MEPCTCFVIGDLFLEYLNKAYTFFNAVLLFVCKTAEINKMEF